MAVGVREADTITVEFFGPFREFGKETAVQADAPVSFDRLVAMLTERLGGPFEERARRSNTTLIVNNRIVSRKRLTEVEIRPGDTVSFALLLGGG